MVLASFLVFTLLVAAITFTLTRKDDHSTSAGYFLGGRKLGAVVIGGSLLLTNLSTEQMVGLNGAAYSDGLAVMVWEVFAVLALVAMAFFFLPRYLRSGISTVPQFLEQRFDARTRTITDVVFLVAYVVILLPIILYTGATGLVDIISVKELLGLGTQETVLGMETDFFVLWITVCGVGVVGSCYALFGGLRTVAISDTLNGIGLLIGGLMITFFGLDAVSRTFGDGGGIFNGWSVIQDRAVEGKTLNSIGAADTSVPFGTIFTGVFLLGMFYWTTNQQIIQRTLGAKNLAEGQKGVMLCAALKLLGPVYLVLPGIMAFVLYSWDPSFKGDKAYGTLVSDVLPGYLVGFFAAVLVGAILSSFNSALNATCTLFSVGVYRNFVNREASEGQMVLSGKRVGWAVAIAAMLIAPWLSKTGGIFQYLQTMNGIYFIPIFSVVVVGMLTKRVPGRAASVALVTGLVVLLAGYFVPIGRKEAKTTYMVLAADAPAELETVQPDGVTLELGEEQTVHPVRVRTGFEEAQADIAVLETVTYVELTKTESAPKYFAPDVMHTFHFLGVVFVGLVLMMLAWGRLKPLEEAWVHEDAGVVDLTPWKGLKVAGGVLIALVILVYVMFADFAALTG